MKCRFFWYVAPFSFFRSAITLALYESTLRTFYPYYNFHQKSIRSQIILNYTKFTNKIYTICKNLLNMMVMYNIQYRILTVIKVILMFTITIKHLKLIYSFSIKEEEEGGWKNENWKQLMSFPPPKINIPDDTYRYYFFFFLEKEWIFIRNNCIISWEKLNINIWSFC